MLVVVGNNVSESLVCPIMSTKFPPKLVLIEIPSLYWSVEYLLVKP